MHRLAVGLLLNPAAADQQSGNDEADKIKNNGAFNPDCLVHKSANSDSEHHKNAKKHLVKTGRFRIMLLRQNGLYQTVFCRKEKLRDSASDK